MQDQQTRYITGRELYTEVIQQIAKAKQFVWIGTADIKDLHVSYKGRTRSFLAVLNDLSVKKIPIRLLHAKEPGPNFTESFKKYPTLQKSIEMQLCPRVHFKHIIIDGNWAYSGSANLTGAGLGMKSETTRNFEFGIVSSQSEFVDAVMEQFDSVWMGSYCSACKRKEYCKQPIV